MKVAIQKSKRSMILFIWRSRTDKTKIWGQNENRGYLWRKCSRIDCGGGYTGIPLSKLIELYILLIVHCTSIKMFILDHLKVIQTHEEYVENTEKHEVKPKSTCNDSRGNHFNGFLSTVVFSGVWDPAIHAALQRLPRVTACSISPAAAPHSLPTLLHLLLHQWVQTTGGKTRRSIRMKAEVTCHISTFTTKSALQCCMSESIFHLENALTKHCFRACHFLLLFVYGWELLKLFIYKSQTERCLI